MAVTHRQHYNKAFTDILNCCDIHFTYIYFISYGEFIKHTHRHTHTHTDIYITLYAFIFESVKKYKWNDETIKISLHFDFVQIFYWLTMKWKVKKIGQKVDSKEYKNAIKSKWKHSLYTSKTKECYKIKI